MEEKNNNGEVNNIFALASKEISENENNNKLVGLNDLISDQIENTKIIPLSEQNKVDNNLDQNNSSVLQDNKIAGVQDVEENRQINPFLDNQVLDNQGESEKIILPNEKNDIVSNKIDNNLEQDSNSVLQNKKIAEVQSNEVNKQYSPFFNNQNATTSVDTDLNINPFFQNKIELNEKNAHDIENKLDLSNVQHYKVKIVKKKPRKLKFILGVLSYAIFIWLLLIGVTLLIYVVDIKVKQMRGDYTPPKYNAYVVLTGSMLPEIKVEDVVITKKTEPEKLNEGDIITFASSDERYYGTIITHRIIKKYYDSTTKKYTYVSKGDNNNVRDNALVEQDNIYGKVILRIPKLGYLQVFLASKGGWILVILLPCLAVISFDIMKLFKIIGKKSKLKIAK